MALLPFELPGYSSSLNSRVSSTLVGPRDDVHAMQLSPDGKFLALGNDGGNLEVGALFMQASSQCSLKYSILDSQNRARLGKSTGLWRKDQNSGCILASIRRKDSLHWMWQWKYPPIEFPIEWGDFDFYNLPSTCANWSKADRIASGQVNGFVHALAMNAEINQLAVAFANSVAVIDKPFSGKIGSNLEIPCASHDHYLLSVVFSGWWARRPEAFENASTWGGEGHQHR